MLGRKVLDSVRPVVQLPRLYHMEVALGKFKEWQVPAQFGKLRAYLEAAKASDAFKNTKYAEDLIIAGWGAKLA